MPGFAPAAKGAQDCNLSASDNVLGTNATVQGAYGTAWVKAKWSIIPACLKSGVVRTVISIRAYTQPSTAYGIVRIDGVDAGTERSTTLEPFQSFTEDITIDKTMTAIEFWIKSSGAVEYVEENEFTLKGDILNVDPEWTVTNP